MGKSKLKHLKFSILVPAYKEEAVIGTALTQLTEEIDYPNYEIIVGIDGDYDNTYKIAKSFAAKFDNIIIDYDPVRKGVTARVNTMLKIATGDIIVKFDADMCLATPKTALYNMEKYFENPKTGAIYYSGAFCEKGDFRHRYERMEPKYVPMYKREIEKSWVGRAENFAAILANQYRLKFFPVVKGTPIPIDTHCFRRELVTDLDENLVHDDIEFALNVLDKGYQIDIAPDIIMFSPGGQPFDTKALWNQKIKGNVGWIQMEKKYKMPFKQYVLGIVWHFLKNIHKCDIRDVFALTGWGFIFVFSYISAFLKKDHDPRKAWTRWERKI